MDDRSERLRRRRKRSTTRSNGQTGETSENDESSGSAESSKPSEPSETSESARESGATEEGSTGNGSEGNDGPAPVKEQQMGTYMYLPETQVKRLRRQYNVLKAEYEFEYDEEFEKNRHYYPLVVQYGLEGLDELDTAQIRTRLQEFY